MRHKKTWRATIAAEKRKRLAEVALPAAHKGRERNVEDIEKRAALAKRSNRKAMILKYANPQNRAKGETGFHDDDEFNRDEDADLVLSESDNEELLREYGNSLSFLVDLQPDQLSKTEAFDGPGAYQRAKNAGAFANNDDNEDDEDGDEDAPERLYKMRRVREQEAEETHKANGSQQISKNKPVKKLLPVRSEDGSRWLAKEEMSALQPSIKNEGVENTSAQEDQEELDATDNDVISEQSASEEEVIDDDSNVEDSDIDDLLSESSEEVMMKNIPRSREDRLEEAQKTLAKMAQLIMGDSANNVKLLSKLFEVMTDKDVQVKKLAILTQLAVYKDIIPGYKIRKLTDQEKSVKVSKEVKTLRDFEQSLISGYQKYLQSVEAIVGRTLKTPGSDMSLAVVGMRALSELLVCVPHFNYRQEIMISVVNRMCVREPEEIGIECCNTIGRLFSEDRTGEFSLEAVRLIFKICKVRDFKVAPRVLHTLLHLRLREELVIESEESVMMKQKERERERERENKKKKANQSTPGHHKTRKQRKLDKELKVVNEQIKSAEMSYDQAAIRKNQTETLKHVFMIYFRILKSNTKDSKLLSTVLEGLTRFAHLINVEFFADLLALLKNISEGLNERYASGIETEDDCRNSLHCIVAAFQLMEGQPGDYLRMDLRDFYVSLYVQLMKLPCFTEELLGNEIKDNYFGGEVSNGASKPSRSPRSRDAVSEAAVSKTQFELALHGFELLFYKKRQIPLERVASFVKRVSTVAIHLPERALVAFLEMVGVLFTRFPRLSPLVDSEEGGGGVRAWRADGSDPDSSGALHGTKLWELRLLQTHYSSRVRRLAVDIVRRGTST